MVMCQPFDQGPNIEPTMMENWDLSLAQRECQENCLMYVMMVEGPDSSLAHER
jgi:hypothetical protein